MLQLIGKSIMSDEAQERIVCSRKSLTMIKMIMKMVAWTKIDAQDEKTITIYWPEEHGMYYSEVSKIEK